MVFQLLQHRSRDTTHLHLKSHGLGLSQGLFDIYSTQRLIEEAPIAGLCILTVLSRLIEAKLENCPRSNP